MCLPSRRPSASAAPWGGPPAGRRRRPPAARANRWKSWRSLRLLRRRVTGVRRRRQLEEELRAIIRRMLHDRNRSLVILDDAISDRQPEARSLPHVLRGEEGVEDALLQPLGDAVAGVAETHFDSVISEMAGHANLLHCRVLHGVARVSQEVDEDLLELDGVCEHARIVRARLNNDLDVPSAE